VGESRGKGITTPLKIGDYEIIMRKPKEEKKITVSLNKTKLYEFIS